MPVTVENLTRRPVLLRLNSGQTLHLAPRTISSETRDVEVEGNAKVEKLKGRRVIAVHKVEEKKRSARGPQKSKAEPTKEEK